MAAQQIQCSKSSRLLSTVFCALKQVSIFCTIETCLFYTTFRLENKKTMCYSMNTKRKAKKQFSKWLQQCHNSNADNVKACILYVMNMNHTEKKVDHMTQDDHGRGSPLIFPFSNRKIRKVHLVIEK